MLTNYQMLHQETPFKGRRCSVTLDDVKITNPDAPDKEVTFEVVRVKDVIAVVLVNVDTKKVVLNRNSRYPVGERFLELIAGQIEPGQTTEDALRSECREEGGFEVTHFTALGEYYTSPGLLTETCTLYVAYGKRTGTKHLDEMEDLVNEEFGPDEIQRMLAAKEIKDIKTALGLTIFLMGASRVIKQ